MIFGSDEDIDAVMECTAELAALWNKYTHKYKTNVVLRAFIMVLSDGATKQPQPMKAVENVVDTLRFVTKEFIAYDKGKQA